MRRRYAFMVVLALSVVAAAALFANRQAGTGATAPIILNAGHNGTTENLLHTAGVKWADAVKEKTDGQVILGCFIEVTCFGVVFIMAAVYGILTPPFGLGLFIVVPQFITLVPNLFAK